MQSNDLQRTQPINKINTKAALANSAIAAEREKKKKKKRITLMARTVVARGQKKYEQPPDIWKSTFQTVKAFNVPDGLMISRI